MIKYAVLVRTHPITRFIIIFFNVGLPEIEQTLTGLYVEEPTSAAKDIPNKTKKVNIDEIKADIFLTNSLLFFINYYFFKLPIVLVIIVPIRSAPRRSAVPIQVFMKTFFAFSSSVGLP